MIKIGILGDIGSGKSYIARNFGYPTFNADDEVKKIYRNNKKIFIKLKKVLPKYIFSFPINKNEISTAILSDKQNLKKIVKIVHLEVRKKLNIFLKKNKNKKITILDIPLLLENKINEKNDILIFVQSKKLNISKRLMKRPNYNQKLLNKFKSIQLPLDYKKKKSHFVIKNNFTKKSVKKDIKNILKKIL
ncbi:dephospho-CoA kinase [Pelagibacterales bacterium SAG-MED01]|nr:dephospho-CoA kinase [Pelagibacterales bacterium SAG-MED01]